MAIPAVAMGVSKLGMGASLGKAAGWLALGYNILSNMNSQDEAIRQRDRNYSLAMKGLSIQRDIAMQQARDQVMESNDKILESEFNAMIKSTQDVESVKAVSGQKGINSYQLIRLLNSDKLANNRKFKEAYKKLSDTYNKQSDNTYKTLENKILSAQQASVVEDRTLDMLLNAFNTGYVMYNQGKQQKELDATKQKVDLAYDNFLARDGG